MQVDLLTITIGLVLGFVGGYLAHRGQLGGRAFKARSHRPSTPEERIDDAATKVVRHWNDATVDRGMDELRGYYEGEGLPLPNDQDLRDQAKELLNASIQGETTVD